MKTLLIGGARSGKSTLAVRWARKHAGPVCCIVTATPSDAEMAARIAAHQRERPREWLVREAPLDLAGALVAAARSHRLLLLDCLTLWTANVMWSCVPAPTGPETHARMIEPDMTGWRERRAAFLASLDAVASDVILVTNEVGAGIVPVESSARVFRDEHGWLNQQVAARCDAVYWVAAGMAMRLTQMP